MDDLIKRVLACANKVSGKKLEVPEGGDLALDAFGFDSLSIFAFMVELENEFGIGIDDTLFNDDQLRSVRSTATLIAAHVPGTHPGVTTGS